jgi:predicted DsbA family dithiol-disulfide isomerase
LAHIETKRKALFIKSFFDAERLIRKAKAQNPNLSDQEAEKLFEKLVDEGQIVMDPEGWWRWTT